jgi:hypothetical protein
MPYHRLYILDAQGHILRVEERDVASDDEALLQARALNHAHGVEIWQGKRKVGIVRPGEPS